VNTAVGTNPEVSIESVSTSSGALEETMGFGLDHDDMLGRVEQTEGNDCYPLPYLSQSQFFSTKDGPRLIERMSPPRMSFQEPFAATNTASSMTIFEENAFQTLLNHTFNNPVDSFNFKLDDPSFYTGQELQLASLPSPSPSDHIIPAAQMVPSQSDWTELSHFSRNVRTGIQQICVTMIIEMVSAYPRMMTRRETLPPFIHTHAPTPSTRSDQNKLPMHIANCMGIAQLFAVRNGDTRSFIWATIRAEMKGFKDKLQTFNKYDVLSALQASLLYIIMRAVEDVPQQANDDYDMLSTYNVILIHSQFLNSHTKQI
jgi:hypothetical protein